MVTGAHNSLSGYWKTACCKYVTGKERDANLPTLVLEERNFMQKKTAFFSLFILSKQTILAISLN